MATAFRCANRQRRWLSFAHVLVGLNCILCVFLFGGRHVLLPNLPANATVAEKDALHSATFIFAFPATTWPIALCIVVYYVVQKSRRATVEQDAASALEMGGTVVAVEPGEAAEAAGAKGTTSREYVVATGT